MHRRTVLVVASLAALLLPFAATADSTIKVGFPMALSGPAALYGQPVLQGAQMYVAELNAKGGVLGKKIELLPRDTKANADEAVRVSRELILKDNVDFLVGSMTSAESPAVSTIAKENKIVFVAPMAKTISSPMRRICIPTSTASPRPRTSKAAPQPSSWRSWPR
jgi:branched-chain amino acid transport system substrate-binding protein